MPDQPLAIPGYRPQPRPGQKAIPKRLYHGTYEGALPKILQYGIMPRPKDSQGNWGHTVVSQESLVYLTDAYALYFALCCASRQPEGTRAVVLAINGRALKERCFLPDEDFIAHCLVRGADGGRYKGHDIEHVTKHVDPREYDHEWRRSLQILGTVGYEGIVPPHAITRIALVTPNDYIIAGGHDPTITPENYRLLGHWYRSFMHWVFDGIAPVQPREPMIPVLMQAANGDGAKLAALEADPVETKRLVNDYLVQYKQYWKTLWQASVEVLSATQARERYLTAALPSN